MFEKSQVYSKALMMIISQYDNRPRKYSAIPRKTKAPGIVLNASRKCCILPLTPRLNSF